VDRTDGYGAPGSRLAERSLSIILANQAGNGAFTAGPTFPQYQFAWLRDGAFIAEALDLVGERKAAGRFHDWVANLVIESKAGLARAARDGAAGVAPDPRDYLHCRYRTDGTVGPADWPTFQLDGPGIWLWSLGVHACSGGQLTAGHRQAAGLVAQYLAALWGYPSYDAWEESPMHVHTSTLAAILAGLRALEIIGLGPVDEKIAQARDAIAERISKGEGCLTKWSGNPDVDGSLLWSAAPYGLFEPGSERFEATLQRLEGELVSPDGGVHRYLSDTYYGGGEWILLTAALGRVYLRRAARGDHERAAACLHWIEAQAGSDLTLPEQVSTRALHPERISEWEQRWGPSARPLLWSHASYLALRHELLATR
jgi:isomaltose glucohydrolase